jgi:hypothetical protein
MPSAAQSGLAGWRSTADELDPVRKVAGPPASSLSSPEREEAVGVVADYERRNRVAGRIVRAIFSRLAGLRYDGSVESRYRLVEALPLLAFSPCGFSNPATDSLTPPPAS